MLERCDINQNKDQLAKVNKDLDRFASDGLRTLVIAQKEITE